MSDVKESVRKWRGLVCPDCRFVFRVPLEHEGKGVACLSCRRLLRIPGEGDEAPPLVASEKERMVATPAQGQVSRRRRVATRESWDENGGDSGGRNTSSGWMRGYLVLAVVALAGLVLWLAKAMDRDVKTVPQVKAREVERVEKSVETDSVQPWYERKEVETLCREFVSAKTVEQMLPLIRDGGRLESVVRGHYPDGKVPGTGLAGLNFLREREEGNGKVATFMVLTKEFKRMPLNICQNGEELKVDWESWVGYSPVTWEEIIKKMPTEPVLVRVLLSDVAYYNMEFADDGKWSSCRMLSPDGQHVVYGYAAMGSEEKEQLSRITSSEPSEDKKVALMIRYPQGAKSKNQVIVDRVVADSWLIFETKP